MTYIRPFIPNSIEIFISIRPIPSVSTYEIVDRTSYIYPNRDMYANCTSALLLFHL